MELNRRQFLQLSGLVAASGVLTACENKQEKQTRLLSEYINTLPREYGQTTWTGEWEIQNIDSGQAILEGFVDENGVFKHIITKIVVPTVSREGTPLTLEQQQVIAKKEAVGTLCAANYTDTQILPTITDAIRDVGIDVLVDGLAAFVLTPQEQQIINMDYLNPEYNYDSNGKPFYHDFQDQTKSILTGYIQWNYESPITPHMIAAIDILSRRQEVIQSGGVGKIGIELINRYLNGYYENK